MQFFVIAGAILLSANSVHAQLQVTAGPSLPSGWTIDSLVQNVLVGEGVEVTNVRFNGSSGAVSCNAIGKFQTGNNPTNIGIASGIIMSSGQVTTAVGPNNTGSAGGPPVGCTSQTCLPLNADATGTTYDCSVLEFDFKPRSDSIKFRYVFGSDEYPEFVCGNVNDIFAFYISGVNPAGGMYSNYNIARVPNDTTVISINTVNGGYSGTPPSGCITTNSQYYVTNNGSTIQYDGFTTVLTAEARVVPCHVYHLIIAIADVGDNVYDSGVFLEANSLTSNAIEFDFTNPANPDNTTDLYEGCEAIIKMSRPHTKSTAERVDIRFEGTAINGVDYTMINSYVMFPADTNAFQIAIQPYQDAEAEGDNGIEYAKFVMSTANGCPNTDSVQFSIIDTWPLTVEIQRDTLMNNTAQIQLRASIEGGMPNRSVSWRNLVNNQTRTGESIVIGTTPDSRWLCEVQDSCGNYGSDTMVVGVRRNFAVLTPDTTICAGEPVTLSIAGADSCVWYVSGSQQPVEMQNTSIVVSPDAHSVYTVHSYIWWNGQIWEDVDSMRIVVIQLPEVHLVAGTTRICEGESANLTASGANQYSWDGGVTFGVSASHSFTPDTTTMYTVLGLTNGAECYGKDSILIIVDTIPAIYLSEGTGVCGGEDAEVSVTTTAESYTWTANPPDPSLGGQENLPYILVNPASTTVYTLNAVNGVCTNSANVTVAVEPQPVAIGEVSPRTVSLGEMEAVFTDLSEHTTSRRWEFPGGEVHTEAQVSYIVPDDVDSVSVRLWAYNPYMCFDTTTVTVYVDHTTLWVPNAFTPEESTNNTFLVKMNDVMRYHIFIYDRRGQLVFESYDQEKAWDGRDKNGKDCAQGVYTYLISCHKITYPYDQIVKKGTVVLIR